MQNLDIQVGDRVTYEVEGIKIITENNNMCTMKTVKEKRMAIVITDEVNADNCQIIKIERIGTNGWYTVYEKDKELLTDEEREFLKGIIKYYNITYILCCENTIDLHDDNYIVACLDYPKDLKFQNIQDKRCSLSELGLYKEE